MNLIILFPRQINFESLLKISRPVFYSFKKEYTVKCDQMWKFKFKYIWLLKNDFVFMKYMSKLRIMSFDCLGGDRREIKNQRLIFVHVWLSIYHQKKANLKHKTALLIYFTCITITFKTRYNLLCGVHQEKTHNFIFSEVTGQQKRRDGQLNCRPLNPRLLLSVTKWPTGNGWSLLWK